MRVVLARSGEGDPASVLAIDVWLHRSRGLIASMAAALGGLDDSLRTLSISRPRKLSPSNARQTRAALSARARISADRSMIVLGSLLGRRCPREHEGSRR